MKYLLNGSTMFFVLFDLLATAVSLVTAAKVTNIVQLTSKEQGTAVKRYYFDLSYESYWKFSFV